MLQRTRWAAGAITAAVLCTVVGASVAAASPNATPSASASATTGVKTPPPGKGSGGGIDQGVLAKVAASLHVSVQQLTTALVDMKKAIGQGDTPAQALAGFAKELNITLAQAKTALAALSGDGKAGKPGKPGSGVPEQAIHLLADELHISVQRAGQVISQLEKLQPTSGDITADPGFVRIAHGLGITPQQLANALIDVKRKLAGSTPRSGPTK